MLSKSQYVEVAFPMHFNQTFTYRWSQDFSNDPVGFRVLVPFQKRLLTGYVLQQSKNTDHEKIKDVQDVLDELPVLTHELIALIHFIKDRYGASLGEALQTVIPTGLIQQTKKKIFPVSREDFPESFEEQKILQTIRQRKEVDWNVWRKKNPQSITHLRNLHKAGWIEIETVFQGQKAREPQEKIYSVHLSSKKTTVKGKNQKQVLDVIEKQKQISLTALKEVFGDKVTATLLSLEKKEIILKKMQKRNEDSNDSLSVKPSLMLTSEQEKIVNGIAASIHNKNQKTILLHGVTGSGKTEVYLQAAQRCLDMGRNVLALVPEISLTPLFLTRFQERFGGRIALLHSQRSETERVQEWKRILDGKAQVVVGTRSCVFSPLKNIGLIIMDEEHDRSYKQEDHVMYHAKEIVRERAEKENSVVLLGSATPSVEAYYATENALIQKEVLSRRIHQDEMPEVEIIDLQTEKNPGDHAIFSEKLKNEIEQTLKNGKQVILFLNRRGFSTHVYCPDCGSTLQCNRCSISMTYHQQSNSFLCHYCDFSVSPQYPCTSCNSNKWIRFGFGTEKVEKELQFLFPDAVIDRLDRDTARKKDTFDRAFSDFENQKTDILIGTQMITKGLDFEHVDLVGVLLADQALHFPDFRAAENTFQLLTQVIGRSGRGKKRGKAILQTLNSNHYAIVCASKQNYAEFYEKEIEYRKKALYPPFSKIVLFEIKGREKNSVTQMAAWLRKQIEKIETKDQSIEILGPSPAPIEKINSNYRYHLLIKSNLESEIENSLKWIYVQSREEFQKRNLHIKFNIDPYDFM